MNSIIILSDDLQGFDTLITPILLGLSDFGEPSLLSEENTGLLLKEPDPLISWKRIFSISHAVPGLTFNKIPSKREG